jgi:hypothetical protein
MPMKADKTKTAPDDRRKGARTCPQCGTAFVCGMAAGEQKCWCADLPPLPIDPSLSACLCPTCLKKRVTELP